MSCCIEFGLCHVCIYIILAHLNDELHWYCVIITISVPCAGQHLYVINIFEVRYAITYGFEVQSSTTNGH
jgi:hypothetical protein